MRLSKKISFVLILTVTATVLVLGTIGLLISSAGLQQANALRSEAIVDGRRNLLVNYLYSTEQQLRTFSQQSQVAAALNLFKLAIERIKFGGGGDGDSARTKEVLLDLINTERAEGELKEFLQKTNSSSFNAEMERFNPLLEGFKELHEFGDLYLVNQDGLVVYSASGGTELTENLIDGELARSGLGKVYNQISASPTTDEFVFSDFERYSIRGDQPTAFLGLPIFNKYDAFIGSLVVQVSETKIAKLLSNTAGLGQSGEVILIRNDGTFLSDSVKTGANDILNTKIDVPSSSENEDMSITFANLTGYRDIESLAAFANLSYRSANWKIATIIDQDEAFSDLKVLKLAFIAVSIVILLIALIAAIWFARSLTRPIHSAIGNMKQLSDGCTNFELQGLKREDEVGDIVRAVEHFKVAAIEKQQLEIDAASNRDRAEQERLENEFRKKKQAEEVDLAVSRLGQALKELSLGDLSAAIGQEFRDDLEPVRHDFNNSISKLRESLTAINESAVSIRDDSNEISDASDKLSRRTESQAAAIEETSAALEELTQNVRAAAERAKNVSQLAQNAKQDTDQSGIVVNKAVSAMDRIEAASQDIKGIINVIDEIAFQTNLLALNAGVEAARAGEAGTGFAVVAQEVRELASRSAAAAKEIKQLIDDSNEQVSEGVQLVKTTGEALESISSQVSQIEQQIVDVSEGSLEQLEGIESINSTVGALDTRIQQNAAMAEETTAATMRLASQIDNLSIEVGHFQLTRNDGVSGLSEFSSNEQTEVEYQSKLSVRR